MEKISSQSPSKEIKIKPWVNARWTELATTGSFGKDMHNCHMLE